MSRHDEFSSLRDLVATEMQRASAATDLALRRAVGDESPVDHEEGMVFVVEALDVLTETIVKLAGMIDFLYREIETLRTR